MTQEEYNRISSLIIGAAIEVHRELGPGLLESVYEFCLAQELRDRNLLIVEQVHLPLFYKGQKLNKEFIIDLLIEKEIIVELKTVETILPVHEVQLVTYLKLAQKKLGLLINFNVPVLRDGVVRKVNNF
ncbi:MAG: GxxExxY protein [Marinilabiliaceae bacterium]|nr:GxxExxY protein [Marinilabiliaceae bacterium]